MRKNRTYGIVVPEELWKQFKATIPKTITINKLIIEAFIKPRIKKYENFIKEQNLIGGEEK